MENALIPGDYFMADKSIFEHSAPRRNDLVIFLYPGDTTVKYVSRCIGLPGDTIEIHDKKVLINGTPTTEPNTVKFIENTILPRRNGRNSRDNFGPFVIPSEHYFVMGDNRDNSSDSRFWGPVPREFIVAKPLRIYWSTDISRTGMALD
jgi:signal peptidase I